MDKEELIEAIEWLEKDADFLEEMINRYKRKGECEAWIISRIADAQFYSKTRAEGYRDKLKKLKDDNYRES